MQRWLRYPDAHRQAGKWAVTLTALLVLGGCGFHLRGMTRLPQAMQPLYVDCHTGIPFDLCNQVKASLRRSGIELAPAQDHAYVLALTRIQTTQRATAITRQATAAAYELRMKVWSRLTAPDGMPVLAESAVRTSETYQYDETNILGKRREEQALNETLYGRVAQQILFRLRPLTQDRLKEIRHRYETGHAAGEKSNDTAAPQSK